jgi:D,D-heptose 1,7-bisphosphate phosphatase
VSTPAVFLDRDGTVMIDHGFVGDPAQVELLPTVIDALTRLRTAGYKLLIISNQSGVARGYFDMSAVHRVEAELVAQLAHFGVQLDGFYVCPHLNEGCSCRKPQPGMLLQAAQEHNLDLSRSVMVGDRGSDVAAGQALGLPGILVLTGKKSYDGPLPDAVLPNLEAVAEWILARGA